MAELSIEAIPVEEARRLSGLSRECYLATFEGTCSDEDMAAYLETAYAPERLVQELSEEDSYFYYLKEGDMVLGYIKVNRGGQQSEEQPRDWLEVERLYIRPGYQGRGLGSVLMDFALVKAGGWDCPYIWLGVWEHNLRAQAFYRKYGFERFSEHAFVMGEEVQCDWLLKRPLVLGQEKEEDDR
ncbi:GNAT family N-acetyltransferase [Aerococcus sp. UMB10185]|uniref:GNAT family N-acetyltransferase n=1 Tax=unclassified Aerococcus TaxID=2618060 RepID=UPI0008A528B5|nr:MULTISPECIES: GNAT family N-acetyltransferase [unclassified Aerococcus]MDK6233043.1 GNAT family N-acetyltransferase [Aerococcus sp. UMB10185]MDK6855338.1 GNAT family N-acetyltransferase [Aerococcus sp. UMB7533]MDK8502195.1 GNAT family N-acetyltransferase [Aerococcus sp. UMB1112A]OFN04916.1 hypothetical protein HMPREF2626_03750 [Aerococcus sp. HMSC062A02]OHO43827.1 hypothetical protein HMPREF2705_07665 [Aerococcus sp. HMSC035B07]